MSPATVAVSDKSNADELIDKAADVLKNSSHRRLVFTAIYRGKSRIKTVEELMDSTKLNINRVLDAGKYLADHDIVFQTKVNNRIAYEKNPFYQHNRDKILRLAANSTARKKFPTKRRVQFADGSLNLQTHVHMKQVQPNKSLTINIGSIENSFNRIESADVPDELKSLLRNLAGAVELVISESPQEDAEIIARDLETFTTEVTSRNPRERWYSLSAEGLEKAAQRVGAIGKPVLELATLIVSLMSSR